MISAAELLRGKCENRNGLLSLAVELHTPALSDHVKRKLEWETPPELTT